MIQPAQSGQALLDSISETPDDPSILHLWWLGQSGFLVKWQETQILFDPYLSDSLTAKYASTETPHVRMSQRVIDPEQLSGIDLVTSSHQHTDHFDPETLLSLRRANPEMKLLLPKSNLKAAEARLRKSLPPLVGINDGDVLQVGACTVIGLPSAHVESPINGAEVERDKLGCCQCMGYIIEIGSFSIYHSGDTVVFDGLEGMLEDHEPDIVFLPINGSDPALGVAGNMNGPEAASLAKACGARLAIPHHYDMFSFNTASPDPFQAGCEALDQACFVPALGQHMAFHQEQGLLQS